MVTTQYIYALSIVSSILNIDISYTYMITRCNPSTCIHTNNDMSIFKIDDIIHFYYDAKLTHVIPMAYF